MTSLVTGVGGLRLAADAVLDLWQREDGASPGDGAAARRELLRSSELVKSWYEDFARSLVSGEEAPPPLAQDEAAERRLLDGVRDELRGGDADARETASGSSGPAIIWTRCGGCSSWSSRRPRLGSVCG